MSLRDEFMDYAKDTIATKYQGFYRVWAKAQNIEKEIGMSLDDPHTREEYISFMARFNARQTARFEEDALCVKAYLIFLVGKGLLPQSSVDTFASVRYKEMPVKEGGDFYYKNIATLKEEVDRAIQNASATNIDIAVFFPSVSAIYLTWHGLQVEEILTLKKKDVLDDRIFVGTREVVLPNFVMDVLKKYRDSAGYYQQAKGVIFWPYEDSEYLFRSNFNSSLTPSQLRTAVSKLNRTADEGHNFSLKNVYMSGVYHRAYVQEVVDKTFNPKTASLEEVVRVLELKSTSRQRKSRALIDYEKYKEMFSN